MKKNIMMNKLVLEQFFVLSIKHLTPLYTTQSLKKRKKCKAV